MFGTNKLATTLIGVGSLGAIGAAGAYYGGLFSNDEKKETIIQTVAKKLEKEGFTVLNSSSAQGDWDAVLSDYKGQNTKTFLTAKTDEAHKAKCQEVLRLENSDNYLDAKRWCVKKEKMSAILKKAGFKPLKASDNVADGENDSWKEKIEKLRTADDKLFEGIKKKLQAGEGQTNHNIALLRTECAKIKIENLHTTSAEFENKFELMKDWCSIKSNP